MTAERGIDTSEGGHYEVDVIPVDLHVLRAMTVYYGHVFIAAGRETLIKMSNDVNDETEAFVRFSAEVEEVATFLASLHNLITRFVEQREQGLDLTAVSEVLMIPSCRNFAHKTLLSGDVVFDQSEGFLKVLENRDVTKEMYVQAKKRLKAAFASARYIPNKVAPAEQEQEQDPINARGPGSDMPS